MGVQNKGFQPFGIEKWSQVPIVAESSTCEVQDAVVKRIIGEEEVRSGNQSPGKARKSPDKTPKMELP